MAPALHSLTIRERGDAEHILRFLLHKHGDLRKLIFENCWLGEEGMGPLADVVYLYPGLESLSLEDCVPLKPTTYCLISRLRKLSELKLSKYQVH